ncbi:MAG: hypothetical protein HY402_03045 [Elusimicrobia bacterium]|nr:hypothetical protein [Elusimicrobiota bacterium]
MTEVGVFKGKNPEGAQYLADFVLSDAVEIREVEYFKVNRLGILRFPFYESRFGRIYPQVRILDAGLYSRMVQAVQSAGTLGASGPPAGTRSSAQGAQPSGPGHFANLGFSVRKIFPLKNAGLRRANAEVVLEEALVVVLGVMKSRMEEGYWIAYPAKKENGKYKKQAWIRDAGLRKRIEETVLREFQKMSGEK